MGTRLSAPMTRYRGLFESNTGRHPAIYRVKCSIKSRKRIKINRSGEPLMIFPTVSIKPKDSLVNSRKWDGNASRLSRWLKQISMGYQNKNAHSNSFPRHLLDALRSSDHSPCKMTVVNSSIVAGSRSLKPFMRSNNSAAAS